MTASIANISGWYRKKKKTRALAALKQELQAEQSGWRRNKLSTRVTARGGSGWDGDPVPCHSEPLSFVTCLQAYRPRTQQLKSTFIIIICSYFFCNEEWGEYLSEIKEIDFEWMRLGRRGLGYSERRSILDCFLMLLKSGARTKLGE